MVRAGTAPVSFLGQRSVRTWGLIRNPADAKRALGR